MKLGDRKSIPVKEFEKINWLSIHETVNQCILSCIYKFHAKKASNYMNEIFSRAECNEIPTCYSHQKLKLPHSKTNKGLRALSYIGPSLCNNRDKSLKISASTNAFKHNIKDYYFQSGNKKESWL